MTENKKEEEEEEEEEEVPQPSFKLTYFPFAGRAFSLRLAAYIGGISYTDEFVTKADHIRVKKANGRRWSGLPELLIYDNNNKGIIRIGQSNSCLRYIGSLCNLYPLSSPLLGALCDEILDSCEDLRLILSGSITRKDDRKKLISSNGKLTYWLTKFEQRLLENVQRGNNNGFVVGDSLTIADLKLFELFHSLWLIFESYEDLPKDLIANYQMIQKHYQLIYKNEIVTEFLQKISLRVSEFKMDPTDDDIKIQTYQGKFIGGSL